MTTRSTPVRRPSISVPSSSGRGAVLSYTVNGSVSILWDDPRGFFVAVCERCCDGFEGYRADEVDDWAESHRCDLELVTLLAQMAHGRAA